MQFLVRLVQQILHGHVELEDLRTRIIGDVGGREPQVDVLPADDRSLATDQRRLRHLIPENRLRIYDVRTVIETMFDAGSVLEVPVTGRDGLPASVGTAVLNLTVAGAAGFVLKDTTAADLIAGRRAPQVLRELRNRRRAPDLNQHVFQFHRFGLFRLRLLASWAASEQASVPTDHS